MPCFKVEARLWKDSFIHQYPRHQFIKAEAIVEKVQLISLDEHFPEYSELKPYLIQ
jgi:PIN domain nuclease of toxin-antitoxin system